MDRAIPIVLLSLLAGGGCGKDTPEGPTPGGTPLQWSQCVGQGGDVDCLDPGIDGVGERRYSPGALGDGFYEIFVTINAHQPSGQVIRDSVWIEVASPSAADSSTGWVVFGHGASGQGFYNGTANCAPWRADKDSRGFPANRSFVEMGFRQVNVFYRNKGSGAPTTSRARARDHGIWDAAAFLAAAQFVRRYHQAGKGAAIQPLALAGSSMGTYPTTWAITDHPALTGLQEGLEIRTAIIDSENANHLANNGIKFWRAVNNDNLVDQLLLLPIGANRVLRLHGHVVNEPSSLDAETQRDLDALLKPAAQALVVDTTFRPASDFGAGSDADIAACDAVERPDLPPSCAVTSAACTNGIITWHAKQQADPSAFATWATTAGVEAISYWNEDDPNLVADPRDTPSALDNPGIRARRELSPVYYDVAKPATTNVLHTISTHDPWYGAVATPFYDSQLEAWGDGATVKVTRPELAVEFAASGTCASDDECAKRDPAHPECDLQRGECFFRCTHGSALDSSHPQCGFLLVRDHLRAAL